MSLPTPLESFSGKSLLRSTPQNYPIEVDAGGATVEIIDDPYSDRVRCDHPPVDVDATEFAETLVLLAEECGRGRVVTLVNAELKDDLEAAGFELEGLIPGFYRGEEDCAVLGYGVEEERMDLANPVAIARTDAVLERPWEEVDLKPPRDWSSELATVADAPQIAALIDATFVDYPTPSSDPAYIAKQIVEGTPFRVVRDGDTVVSCASADLVREAMTAELTDCATQQTHRGRGYMQGILQDLMGDLQAMNYPTAFTLARARIPGVNRAFQKLGFDLRGRMAQSCRIGKGFEDMNIWSRAL